MSHAKLDYYLQQNQLPSRLLLSGSGDLWALALEVAAKRINQDLGPITQGVEADVKLCPDDGQTLKIGDSQSPDALSVRGLLAWLNQTPVASHRVLVLQNLERTSRDAMQAWLKVLEEPPARTQFILTTQNHHRLPTTILSRLTVLNISDDRPSREVNSDIDTFLSTSDTITQFQLIDSLDKSHKDNPHATKNFVEDLLTHARAQPRYQALLPILFTAHQDLERNVNRRLVLEHLALQLQNR